MTARALSYLHVLAALILWLSTASVAHGQGAAPFLPDPISTIRLHRLLEGLTQSEDARWPAIEKLHDEYLAEFARLRAERIVPWLVRLGPEWSVDHRSLEEGKRIVAQIVAADERLFAGLGALLGEDHVPGLALARDRRLRERLNASFAPLTRIAPNTAALADSVRVADLTPAVRAALEPELQAYERKAAPLHRRVWEKSMAAVEEDLKASGEANDSASARRGEATALKQQLADLDRSTARRLLALAPFPDRRELLFRLGRANHGVDADFGGAWIEMAFRLALQSPELSEEARRSAREAYRAWSEAEDPFLQRLSALDRSDPDWTDELRVIESERDILRQRVIDRLTQGSEEWVVTIRPRWQALSEGRHPIEFDPFDREFLRSAPALRPPSGDAAWLPPPISDARVERLIVRLGLDADAASVVRSLRADAESRADEALWPLIDRVRTARDSLWREEGGDFRQDAAALAAMDEAKGALLEACAAADDAFYQDIAAALGDRLDDAGRMELALSRASRTLERLAIGDWAMYLPWDRIVRPVDPIAVIDGLPLSHDERATVRKALLAHLPEILAAAEKRALAQRGLCELMDSLFDLERQASERLDAAVDDAERDAARAARVAMRDAVDAETDRRSDARLAADRAVRARFGEVVELLSGNLRREAIEGYERRAVPEFFADPRAPWPWFDRVLSSTSLSAAERESVAALREGTALAYFETIVAFADHRRTPIARDTDPHAGGGGRRARELEILFRRDEISARSIARLRRLLPSDEIRRAAELDDYERRVEVVSPVHIRFVEE